MAEERRFRLLAALLVAGALLAAIPSGAGADAPGNEYFRATWERTDAPVGIGMASRTWMWGPEAFTPAGIERYLDAPNGWRTVQYFDKARMEITHPDGDPSSVWYVTNGLLVVEMATGLVQDGDNHFAHRGPAEVNVAGDADDPTGPTYETISLVRSNAARATGSLITQRLLRTGMTFYDSDLADYGVTSIYRVTVPGIDHQVASVFWTFMNSTGTVVEDGRLVNAPLFVNPFYATGYPITEAYWANVKVGGIYRDVLLQCFERRCLTYTPDNPPGWRVEAGNVGQHYYNWRYPRPSMAMGPVGGLMLYRSELDDWASWPSGSPRADEPRLLGNLDGRAERHGEVYSIEVPGGANRWTAARTKSGDYEDVIIDSEVRMVAGAAGDVACLLTRLEGEGSSDVADNYEMYALCIEASGTIAAFHYALTPAGATSTWLLPPGTVSLLSPATNWHLFGIAVSDHDLWFVVDEHLVGAAHHAGRLSGAVGIGVQRFAGGAAPAEFEFRNLTIRLNRD